MQYEDDEGDRVILVADDDLVNAITYARLSGAKVLYSFLVQLFNMPTNTIDNMFPKLS